MTEDIKSLIEKIQQEGVQIAEEKARKIQQEAKDLAGAIIKNAKLEAEQIIAQAREQNSRMEKAQLATLAQAGRNTLLSLKSEILAVLQSLIAKSVQKALSPQELAGIIAKLVHENKGKQKEEIIISLSQHDLKHAEEGLLKQLSEELKKGITLQSSDQIGAGFTISFDAGKSHFDFTDKALAEYLSLYLEPALGDILKKTV